MFVVLSMPLVNIYIHHGGSFATQPDCGYIGGKIDHLLDMDSDVISFEHLVNYANLF